MELTRYRASYVVLPGTGQLHGYRSAPWVRVVSLGTSCLHAMCWSSVTLSAILGKVASRSLPNPSLLPCIVRLSLELAPHGGGGGGGAVRRSDEASLAIMCIVRISYHFS